MQVQSSTLNRHVAMNLELAVLQIVLATSIYFVWVVRYENIVEEFRSYGLPDWLRDVVGILKLSFALMLLIGIWQPSLSAVGGGGVAFLMLCAILTHVKVRNPVLKMLPALSLLLVSIGVVAMSSGSL
ncbi:MAG: putative membrane protein YphA (DoxX/SURF4 family) [Planctomycetota bacterium]|jgi:uncharacterized membrane protein YphA (DoxX/SURF4 family)